MSSDDLPQTIAQEALTPSRDEQATTDSETGPVSSLTLAPAVRYTLGAELARGGMGVVHRATDNVLHREVAIKVLQDRYGPDSGTARRFADEARITGQLQHPGVPPVHDLGTLADGRAFLAMKLIKGETLDALLKRRSDPTIDRSRYLAAFEKVCEAVAYAHAHGVIHRDLKPANVMVGAFGEVQVMDWGLAKVVGARTMDVSDPESTDGDEEVISSRTSEDQFTLAGSVLGTPAYMPPEQAIGAIERVGPRSDVFGLGAILAVILTGRPPFLADSGENARQQAALGKVQACFERLQTCGALPEMISLAKRCLAPDPDDRPADAGEVARMVADLRTATEERARQAELDRARTEAEKIERQKRLRIWRGAGLTVGVLLLLLALGATGAAFRLAGQRDEIAAKKQLADGRLELARRINDRMVNELPLVLDGQPLATAALAEQLTILIAALEDLNKEVDDANVVERSRLSLLLRRGQLASLQNDAAAATARFAEARDLAERLTAEGQPERTKAIGNLAVLLRAEGILLLNQARSFRRTDPSRALSLTQQALTRMREAQQHEEQARTLDPAPLTRAEVRTWVPNSQVQLAEGLRFLASLQPSEAANQSLQQSRDQAREAIAELQSLLAGDGLSPGVAERSRVQLGIANLELARALDMLGEASATEAAYREADTIFTALVKERPQNLRYKISGSVIAAELGDFLLIKRNNPSAARAVYTTAVLNVRAVAQPPELALHQSTLALNYYRLGTATKDTGDVTNARRYFGLCADLRAMQLKEQEGAAKPNPGAVIGARINLMLAQARAGKVVEAAALARQLTEDPLKNARIVALAASGYGLCADVDDSPMRGQYEKLARATLLQALDLKYADVKYLETDPDAAPLRRLPDFETLLQRAKSNATPPKPKS